MKRKTIGAGCALIMLTGLAVASAAEAQRLDRLLKRSVESEARREADRRAREATRCVLGSDRCPEERDEDSRPAARATAAPARAAAPARSSGDASDYLIPSGGQARTGAGAAPVEPFVVPAISGASVVETKVTDATPYTRIIGVSGGSVRTDVVTGRLTRTHYELNGGRSTAAAIAAWRDPLVRQGMKILWQCDSRVACGSTARHANGRGWNGVNGLNMGAAGDVRYFTGRIDRPAPAGPVYVAIGVNPTDAHVHVVEVTN